MIKAYIIDDERPALQELEYLLGGYPDIEVTRVFEDPLNALGEIEADKPDVVFLDIDMPHMNGIELGIKIQALRAGIIIVFVTAYSEYSLEAFNAYPLDYILKPIDEERFRQTIEHVIEQHKLRQKVSNNRQDIFIRCFGRLEITKNGQTKESMKLTNKKLKELLAYLIHRFGKPVTRKELLQLLFDGVEDKKTVNYLHVTVYNIRNMLESFGIDRSQVLIKENYTLEIAPEICDYVDFVNFIATQPVVDAANVQEVERLIALYSGAYLEEDDYTWTVDTREWLEECFESLLLKLATYYDANGKFERAEHALLRLLNKNPLSEQGNAILMDIYIARQRYDKFINHYLNYKKVLTEELGVEPEEKFTAYYKLAVKDVIENSR